MTLICELYGSLVILTATHKA